VRIGNPQSRNILKWKCPGLPPSNFQSSLRDFSSLKSLPKTASWAKFSRPSGTHFGIGQCGTAEAEAVPFVQRVFPQTELATEATSSAPEASIQRAVLNRLRNMPHRNPRLGIEVGNGTSDLQYPVVRSRAQALLLHGPFQQTFRFR
jgi:hypothetical protein